MHYISDFSMMAVIESKLFRLTCLELLQDNFTTFSVEIKVLINVLNSLDNDFSSIFSKSDFVNLLSSLLWVQHCPNYLTSVCTTIVDLPGNGFSKKHISSLSVSYTHLTLPTKRIV